jgi:ATP-dependent DNA ligase
MGIDFMLCEKTSKEELFNLDRDRFKAQVKIDGERIKATIHKGNVEMINRRNLDKSNHYLEVAEELKLLPNCTIDSEVITFDDDFNKLQRRALTKDIMKQKLLRNIIPVKMVVFDILELNGKDLRNLPYSERLEMLDSLNLNRFKHIEKIKTYEIDICYDIAKESSREGVVAKDMYSVYEYRRSNSWKKFKFFKEGILRVIRYTENPKGITAEDEKGERVAILGEQSRGVKDTINNKGYCNIDVQFLTESADTGKKRFISFRGISK